MNRIEVLRDKMAREAIDCALLLYHRDIFYYAGTARPASLLVTQKDSVLFARRGVDLAFTEASGSEVREGGLKAILDFVSANGLGRSRVGVEMDLIPASMYLRLKDLLPGSEFKDVSPLVLEQRLIKDADELESVKRACRMVEEPHRRLPHVAKPGMMEFELAAELERIARLAGHETFAILRKRMETEMGFALVLSGESTMTMGGYGQVVTGTGLSTAFPYGPSQRKLEKGEVLVFDIAGLSRGYHSDLARTYFLGRAPSKVKEAHSALVQIQKEIISAARPGRIASEIYEIARAEARHLGWDAHFQGQGRDQGSFVGHGLGLEIDEPPLLSSRDKTVIAENMTFTTELFIVHPEFGEVKLEDTVVVKPERTEFLTHLERRVFEIAR